MQKLLTELFETYHMDVYTYLYSLCRDPSTAEDLTSEVFVDVVRSIAAFRGESDLRTWLFTIARRRWIDHLRKRNRRITTESLSLLTDLPAPDDTDTGELMDLLHRALAREPEQTRRVVELRMEGYSYFEIGKHLNISENSARVIFFRAKTRIRTYFEKEGICLD